MALELFTIFYFIISAGLIYPPAEFVAVGLTIENLFSKFLGNPLENILQYHLKRSILSLFVYSMLPLVYILMILYLNYVEFSFLFSDTSLIIKCFTTTAIVLPMFAMYQIYNWVSNNYKSHPTVQNLSKFASESENWETLASEINTEYRRITKVSLKINPIVTLVVTDSWVLKICPFVTHIAKLEDTNIQVVESRLFSLAQDYSENQVLKLEVKSRNNKFENFNILLNILAFRELESQLQRRIPISTGITIHRTDAEQFIHEFKKVVNENPKYHPTEESEERCIGCFQALPDVKLKKNCQDVNEAQNCTTCQCRPSWCLQCMGQWFASRQDPEKKSEWMSSKCTCPMCRSIFCVLDVHLLENN
ncbi:unnamed protein product [Brassicogethes aeneus]|uniref:Transmembrane protein 129 n=1 Tax=Brassicogethes aeneus TaxID=1431903 RepID=A0A9P0FI67_BRAAE|nr:unnamed protein product [Brassicogethes aeneus]